MAEKFEIVDGQEKTFPFLFPWSSEEERIASNARPIDNPENEWVLMYGPRVGYVSCDYGQHYVDSHVEEVDTGETETVTIVTGTETIQEQLTDSDGTPIIGIDGEPVTYEKTVDITEEVERPVIKNVTVFDGERDESCFRLTTISKFVTVFRNRDAAVKESNRIYSTTGLLFTLHTKNYFDTQAQYSGNMEIVARNDTITRAEIDARIREYAGTESDTEPEDGVPGSSGDVGPDGELDDGAENGDTVLEIEQPV